ncbi:hypothetical protein GCM10009555_017710 [Acrocarpospora macrocephala]|uniref:Uncharacterized protein n=1 Tax=Acrocarpospora macrocephala TaxID=150177 RepID=A0A5M3WJR3_9ACTN|nr:hypothetical protein [Acrocarpospora macrocephala]GES07431.1 hypothetical protein Amac_010260 [Acrocarpospora macrocephala]
MALPALLPCPITGDVILVPVGTVSTRMTADERRELIRRLAEFDRTHPEASA